MLINIALTYFYIKCKVDLPEIKGNHRKFRTLVSSYIGKLKIKKNSTIQFFFLKSIKLSLFYFIFIFICMYDFNFLWIFTIILFLIISILIIEILF